MALRSVVTGVGSYLPKRVLANEELARQVDTSDEWIVERTGIRQRHIAAKDERTSDLAIAAAIAALKSAGREAKDVELVIVATTTSDLTFPATAARVQAALGIPPGAAFDLQAVCSGFIFALTTADNFLRLGQARVALVIGAETFSRIVD
jgi:3-oxoacyl-[acyl-carrier-protein] synthase-3